METGYAKLIANLKVLIFAGIRFAEKFNPSKPSLKLDSMAALGGRSGFPSDARIDRIV